MNLLIEKTKNRNLVHLFFFGPEEMEKHNWNFYYTNNVVEEINHIKSVWCSPSDKLLSLCKDTGTIQFGHTDLEKLISNDNKELERIVYEACFNRQCGNCVNFGFPCTNASIHGNFNKKLMQFWSIT